MIDKLKDVERIQPWKKMNNAPRNGRIRDSNEMCSGVPLHARNKLYDNDKSAYEICIKNLMPSLFNHGSKGAIHASSGSINP